MEYRDYVIRAVYEITNARDDYKECNRLLEELISYILNNFDDFETDSYYDEAKECIENKEYIMTSLSKWSDVVFVIAIFKHLLTVVEVPLDPRKLKKSFKRFNDKYLPLIQYR